MVRKIKAYYIYASAHQSAKEEQFKLKRDGTPIILLNDHILIGKVTLKLERLRVIID